MATITIETKVNFRYLMSRSKQELADMVMMLLDEVPEEKSIKASKVSRNDVMLLIAKQISPEGIDKILEILTWMKNNP